MQQKQNKTKQNKTRRPFGSIHAAQPLPPMFPFPVNDTTEQSVA